MESLRALLFLCIVILVGIVSLTFLGLTSDRYILVPQTQGVFVFDKKSTKLTYCSSDSCQTLLGNFNNDLMSELAAVQSSSWSTISPVKKPPSKKVSQKSEKAEPMKISDEDGNSEDQKDETSTDDTTSQESV